MSSKLRVAIINTEGLDNWSGSISVWAYNQAKLLRNRGHEVHLIVKNRTPLPNNLKGIKIHFVEFNNIKISLWELIKNRFNRYKIKYNRYLLSLKSKVEELFEKDMIDVVDIPDIYGEASSVLDLNRPVLVRAHHSNYINSIIFSKTDYCRDIIEKEKDCIEKAKALSFVSKHSFDLYQNNFDLSNKEIFTLLYPFELQFFSCDDNIEKEEGLDILFVGRFNDKNGIKDLINFINVTSDIENITLRFNIVGGENPEALKELKELSKSGANIEISNFISRPKMVEKYQNSDVVIFPQKSESVSYSLLEAMSCGRVVLVANSSGNSDFIEDGYNGFLFKNGDLANLVILIKKLYGKKKLLRYIGQNATQKIKRDFDYKKIYDSSITAYNEVIKLYNR